jgi:D-alanine-D-alanine ligase
MNIAVLFGGISPERNVSIVGGKAVVEALRSKGHKVIPIDPALGNDYQKAEDEIADMMQLPSDEELQGFHTKNYIDTIALPIFNDIDIAFIVLHGKYGEDGLIQSLLELRSVPYTGSNVKASALSMDKATSKNLFAASGILTPPWLVIRENDADDPEIFKDIRKELGNEIVFKPNDQGSSVGISIVMNGNLDEIEKAYQLAHKYSDTVLVEKYIPGREITVGLIGGEALPVIEIVPEEKFYDYEHKYTKGRTQYICPADLSEDIEEFVQSIAVVANNIIGARGFARADFRFTPENEPYLLELNTIPGFTPTSLVPMAAKEVGIEFPDLCENIINLALNK